QLAPWASYPAYNMGLLLETLNRVDDARAEFKRALANAAPPGMAAGSLQRWAGLPDGLNALATLEVNQGHWKLARQYLDDALRLNPTHALAQHNLALLQSEHLGQSEKAIETWRTLLGNDPANAVFRNSLAHALAKIGRSDQSVHE